MKIRFICTNVNSGSCGVGDTTNRLALELSDLGHEVQIFATHDKFIKDTITDSIISKRKSLVKRYRFPRCKPNAWLDFMLSIKDHDNWLYSYQFPGFYHYHFKGLPLSTWGTIKSALKLTLKLHVMVHETWLVNDPSVQLSKLGIKNILRKKIRSSIGYIQRKSLGGWLKTLPSAIITTSNHAYAVMLRREGVEVSLLSIPSTISKDSREQGWLDCKLTQWVGDKPFLVGIFGTIWEDFNPSCFLEKLCDQLGRDDRSCILVIVGHTSSRVNSLIAQLNKLKIKNFNTLVLGPQTEARVADFLQTIDLGVSTNRPSIVEKSSSTLTMAEFGLPVVVLGNSDEASVQVRMTSRYIFLNHDDDFDLAMFKKAVFSIQLNRLPINFLF